MKRPPRVSPLDGHLVAPLRHWALRAVFNARLEAAGQPRGDAQKHDVLLARGLKR